MGKAEKTSMHEVKAVKPNDPVGAEILIGKKHEIEMYEGPKKPCKHEFESVDIDGTQECRKCYKFDWEINEKV